MRPKAMDGEQVAEPLTNAGFEALAHFRFGWGETADGEA
jgi:hypothetical protein